MDLRVLDHVTGCDTASQGSRILVAALSVIDRDGSVRLDFGGVPNATSSFVNTSLVCLCEHLGPDRFRRSVVVTGANRQISNLIVDRIKKASGLVAA